MSPLRRLQECGLWEDDPYFPYPHLRLIIIIITGKVDLQERGLRDDDWDDPIDGRDQEYNQKFAADSSNHAQTLANFAELGR